MHHTKAQIRLGFGVFESVHRSLKDFELMKQDAMLAFWSAVRFCLRGLGRVGIVDREELEQELFVKLMEIWPRLQDLPCKERIPFAVSSLRRRGVDLIRKERHRSHHSLEYISVFKDPEKHRGSNVHLGDYAEKMITNELEVVNRIFSQVNPSQSEIFDGAELIRIVADWGKTQPTTIQNALSRFISLDGNPVKTGKTKPTAAGDFYGVSKTTWRRKRAELAVLVAQGGFAV